jgi:hypothetical protein
MAKEIKTRRTPIVYKRPVLDRDAQTSIKFISELNLKCKLMVIGMSFTKFLFFMWIGNPRWPPPQDID